MVTVVVWGGLRVSAILLVISMVGCLVSVSVTLICRCRLLESWRGRWVSRAVGLLRLILVVR